MSTKQPVYIQMGWLIFHRYVVLKRLRKTCFYFPDEITLSVEAESLLDHPMASAKSSDRYRNPMEARTCQTSFLHQLCILTIRNFHNARRRILFPVR